MDNEPRVVTYVAKGGFCPNPDCRDPECVSARRYSPGWPSSNPPTQPQEVMDKRFPIQFGDGFKDVPWAMIAPHERQALRNHDQTLERLAQRGGLSPDEAIAVLEDRQWTAIDVPSETNSWPPRCLKSSKQLRELVSAWESSR